MKEALKLHGTQTLPFLAEGKSPLSVWSGDVMHMWAPMCVLQTRASFQESTWWKEPSLRNSERCPDRGAPFHCDGLICVLCCHFYLLGLNWVRIFLLSRLLCTISWMEDSGRNENISNTTKIQVWPCGRCWQRGWQPVQVCHGLFQLSLAGPDPENLSGPRPTWVAGLPAESTKGPPAGKVFLLFTVSPGLLYQNVPGDTPSNHSRSLKTQRMKSGASHSAWLWDCPDIRYYPSKGLTEGSGMFGISLAFLWLAH